MSLRHGLLGLLNYKPMTGYELNKEFKESLGNFWQAKSQQIYKELDMMEKNGWLTSERIMQQEKPNKRVYSITPIGKQEFKNWLAAPEADIKSAMYGKNAILMRLGFAGEGSKAQALELLHSFKNECIAYANNLNEARDVIARDEAVYSPNIMKYWKLTLLHGDIMLKAKLEWVEQAINILENEQTGEITCKTYQCSKDMNQITCLASGKKDL